MTFVISVKARFDSRVKAVGFLGGKGSVVLKVMARYDSVGRVTKNGVAKRVCAYIPPNAQVFVDLSCQF